jgi:hypothetical protein
VRWSFTRGLGPLTEVGTHPRGRQAFERDRASREGLGPSSEAGTHSRGRQALERGGCFVLQRLPLERDRGSLEGHRGWLSDGSLRFFGPLVGASSADCLTRGHRPSTRQKLLPDRPQVGYETSLFRGGVLVVRGSFSDRPLRPHGPSTCSSWTVRQDTVDCPPQAAQSC